jgi:hypothetical protein
LFSEREPVALTVAAERLIHPAMLPAHWRWKESKPMPIVFLRTRSR